MYIEVHRHWAAKYAKNTMDPGALLNYNFN